MAMLWVMMAAAAQAATPMPAPPPSAEAEQLGMRLAQTGMLATIAPLLAAKDVDEVVAQHPELSDADKAAFRATAKRIERESLARINTAFGHAYAKRLSVAELRALVAHAESPAAAHWRQIMPGALTEAMTAAGNLDFKREAVAAYCRETGKLCPAPKK